MTCAECGSESSLVDRMGVKTVEASVFDMIDLICRKKPVKAIEKPVTVKIRKGFDEDHVNAVEIAKIAEEAGQIKQKIFDEKECQISIQQRLERVNVDISNWSIVQNVLSHKEHP